MYYKKVLYLTRWKKVMAFVKTMNDYRLNQYNNFVLKVVITADAMYCTLVTFL